MERKINRGRVAELRLKGFGYSRIAQELGVSKSGIQAILNKIKTDYKPSSERDSPQQWAQRCLYKPGRKGLTLTEVLREIPLDLCCPVFGMPLVFHGHTEDSASLDRIEPQKGYVRGNIAVISMKANRLKNNAGPADLLRIAAWIAGRQGTSSQLASRLRDEGWSLKDIGKAMGVSITKAFWLSGGKRSPGS